MAEPKNFNPLLLEMLARPNICSKEWITRQYDHEVQGGSVIKPLVGKEHDVYSDATVIRPVLSSSKGIVFSQAILPMYSAIDAYHMTTCTIDEAVRRMVAVGGDPDHIGGVDNFCWPNIAYDPDKNPDGRFKAAQLSGPAEHFIKCAWHTAFLCYPEKTVCMWTAICRENMVSLTKYLLWKPCSFRMRCH